MFDKDRLTTALRHKVDYAKGIDRDFVCIPVWQARDLVEYLEPMKPRKAINCYVCDRCGNHLVKQKHCDECGQLIDWKEIERE